MINDAIIKWGVIAIFLFMVSNGFISTPPSEVVLSIAGALTINNNLYFYFIFLGVVLANYIGTSILYLLSRFKGRIWYDKIRANKVFKKISFLDKLIPTSEKLINFFNNQEWLIFACRFLPFIRSIVSVPAGIAKMNFLKFTVYTLIGISIWSFVWLWVGRATLSNVMKGNRFIFLLLAMLFVLSGLIGKIIRKKLNNN